MLLCCCAADAPKESLSSRLNTMISTSKAKRVLIQTENVTPAKGFLKPLWADRAGFIGVIPRVLDAWGLVRHAGFEWVDHPLVIGSAPLLAHRLRGVPFGYSTSLLPTTVKAADGYCILLSVADVMAAGGLAAELEPDLHFAHLTLRMGVAAKANGVGPVAYRPASAVFHYSASDPLPATEVADVFDEAPSRRVFLQNTELPDLNGTNHPAAPQQGRSADIIYRCDVLSPPIWCLLSVMMIADPRRVVTKVGVRWYMHCAGSMGYEAAMFFPELERMVPLRVEPLAYTDCPWVKTIATLPAFYRDAIERLRFKPAAPHLPDRVCTFGYHYVCVVLVIFVTDFRSCT
jgi:hypothetical protein